MSPSTSSWTGCSPATRRGRSRARRTARPTSRSTPRSRTRGRAHRHGRPLSGGRRDDPHGAHRARDAGGGGEGELTSGAGPMALTLSRGRESRQARADQPSNVFLRSRSSSASRGCARSSKREAALVEFPGSPSPSRATRRSTGRTPASRSTRSSAACSARRSWRARRGRSSPRSTRGAASPWRAADASRSSTPSSPRRPPEAEDPRRPRRGGGHGHRPCAGEGRRGEARVQLPPAGAGGPCEARQVRQAARLPAVAFFSGSGPQDRDEDTVGPGGVKLSIFKVMAIGLAEKGVASLRCDDRGPRSRRACSSRRRSPRSCATLRRS